MGFAIFTFVLCLTLILGVYWYLIVRPEVEDAQVVARRVRKLNQPASTTSASGVTTDEARISAIPALETLLRRNERFTAAVQQLLLEADVRMSVGVFLAASFATAALGWALGLLAVKMVVVGLVLAALGAAIPYAIVNHKRTKRLQVFEEQFPEAIDLIARALRAGHAFTTGLNIAADEMPDPVGGEFKRAFDQQNFGMSMPEALKGMARRVPVIDARFFVTAVLTQRESGGNLAEILDNLSHVMRERFKVRRQIRVTSAHGRMSGWVLSLMPPALAAVLFTIQPAYMRLLVEDPLGLRLVVAAICLQALGMYIISRLIRIEY